MHNACKWSRTVSLPSVFQGIIMKNFSNCMKKVSLKYHGKNRDLPPKVHIVVSSYCLCLVHPNSYTAAKPWRADLVKVEI